MYQVIGSWAAMVLAVGLTVGTPVRAQVLDHLKCHKVSDGQRPSVTYSIAHLGASPELADFSASGCSVRGRINYVCVAVTKVNPTTGNPPQPPPHPEITGPALSTAYSCYKLRCPGHPANHLVSDQFGADVTVTNYRSQLLCLPAQVTPQCGFDPQTHICGGQCPLGLACQINSTNECSCQSLPCSNTSPSECTRGGCDTGTCTLFPSGACGCRPALCGESSDPQCGGTCPVDQATHTIDTFCGRLGLDGQGHDQGCGCFPPGLACGDATAPQCDGACPSGFSCISNLGGGGACRCAQSSGTPCGDFFGGSPLCWGECRDPATPICRDANGTCTCTAP